MLRNNEIRNQFIQIRITCPKLKENISSNLYLAILEKKLFNSIQLYLKTSFIICKCCSRKTFLLLRVHIWVISLPITYRYKLPPLSNIVISFIFTTSAWWEKINFILCCTLEFLLMNYLHPKYIRNRIIISMYQMYSRVDFLWLMLKKKKINTDW